MSTTTITSTPLTADYFLSTLGVDTHIGYTDGGYANLQNIIADLKYLGISEVRDGISDGENGSAPLSSYITLAEAGIRFSFIIYNVTDTADLNAMLGLINQVEAAVPGSVLAIEGPNEINNDPVTYNGVSGLQGALNEQAAIYSAVHSDATLAGVPVYYFTGYGAGGVGVGPDPSVTPGLADYDNQHPYPNNGQAPSAYDARSAALINETSQTAPAVYTETGYTTLAVNADVQAKYELDLFMDTASEDITKTFLYELMDGYAPGSPQGDAGYGLFDYTNAPKEVATALHDLTALLQDNGANAAIFVPSSITYSLTGLPSTGNSLALEKSDGTEIISVWAEPQIWDNNTETEVAAAASQVTVGLGGTYSAVNVFDPLFGTSAIASYANVSSVTISVTDHPILVEFSGGSASPAPAPTPTPAPAPAPAPATSAPTPTPTSPTPIQSSALLSPTPAPGGSDTLVLNVSEIPINGEDAQFTVSVDGIQVGGTQTVTAQRSTGASQNVILTGSFGSGPHTVTLDFINGYAGNPADGGRLLYLNALTFDDATTFPDGQFYTYAVVNYTVQAPAPAVVSNVGSTDTLVLNLSETAVNGENAQFMVSVDGQIVGGVQTVTASYASGQSQNVTLTGDFGTGQHTVAIDFLNGFGGSTADIGRQLYVNSITLDGALTTENSTQTFLGAESYEVTAGAQTQAIDSSTTSTVAPTGGQTFTYNAGGGALDINEVNAAGNVLQFGPGLSPENVVLTAGANGALIITDGISGDVISIDGMLSAAGNGVSQMQFADGTVWTASQITSDATNGTTGADTIVGTAGNDVIDGRGGGDTVFGNGGNDTYIFRLGYGSLQIINSTPTGTSASGQLDFGAGLTQNNLWFVQNGNDLDVDILNSQDQIVISGWFGANPSASLAEFVSGDGLKLDGAFAQLLSAMAVYQANNPGFDPGTAGAMPTDSALRNAISTAWHS